MSDVSFTGISNFRNLVKYFIQYIDPDLYPWEEETDNIWKWMKAVWKANVVTYSVPDTPENRRQEKREITSVI